MKKLFAILLAAVAVTAQAQEITGAGATFPAPLYSKWAAEYNKATNVRVNYQSVGSGAGLNQIIATTNVQSNTLTFDGFCLYDRHFR